MREDQSVYRRAWELLRVKINAHYSDDAVFYDGQMIKHMMPRLMKDCLDEAVKEFKEQGRQIDMDVTIRNPDGTFDDSDIPTDADDPTKYEETGPE